MRTPAGWLALMVAVLPAICLPQLAHAQLRPIDPIDWRTFESSSDVMLALGMGVLWDQHASLAGTKGTLLELGNFNATWRTGRVVLELSGTMHRRFDDQVVVREPDPAATPPTGEWRHDAGDIRASTIVRLNGSANAALFALRFGTRLPTTSDESGLDRDRTDFFATFGARWRTGPVVLSGESGVGINGTRRDGYDQSDVLTYSLGVEVRMGPFTPTAALVGHFDGTDLEVRGNEDLSELRLGVRAGERYWIQASAIRGIAEFSPGGGFLLMAGIRP